MSTSVPVSFIEQYEMDVKQSYQREGSLLRGTVRTRTGVNSSRVYFPKLGKGTATTKARHADVVPMDLEHTRVFADMADYYAPEYIDELDQAKFNWSAVSEYSRASGYALGRQTDEIIIGALNAAPAGQRIGDAAPGIDATLTKSTIVTIAKTLNAADIPLDANRYAVVSPDVHAELLQLTEATSTDFTTTQLLMQGGTPPMWMGFRWIMHTGLPTGVRGFFYHNLSVGHAIAQDVRTEVNYIPEKVSWLVNSYMSMGATIIDPTGVVVLVP